MGRSRIFNTAFWKDPDLTDLTTEERFTLFLFLTCEESGVIGVYRVMWRAVGVGAGWTEPQVLNALKHLQDKGLIEFDEVSGWVWVKEWWKHNSLKGAFTGNVQKKAYEELGCVPAMWRGGVIQWLKKYDPDGVLQGLGTPSEGYPDGVPSTSEEAGGNPNPNPIPTSISTTTNPVGSGIKTIEDLEDLIEAAVWIQRKKKPMTNEPRFREVVRARIISDGANSSDLNSLEKWRSEFAARHELEQIQHQEQQAKAEQQAREAAAHAVAYAHFESLNEDTKQSVITEFGAFLEQNNRPVFNLYRKDGLASKFVRTDFTKFLAANMNASQGNKHEL